MSRKYLMIAALMYLAFTTAAARHAAAEQGMSADEKEIAAYKLTMPTVKKVMAASMTMAEEAAKDPKAQERKKVKAQIDALEAKDELTEAQEAELEKLRERLDALEREEDESTSNTTKSLAEMEAFLKKHPGGMRALAREGLTPREFAVCTMALLQAAMVEGFSQGKADLKNLPPGINPDNVRFVRENKAELEAMQRAIADATKKSPEI